jgi:hypothetical protein
MARGVKFGRKRALTPFQIQEALARREAGEPLIDKELRRKPLDNISVVALYPPRLAHQITWPTNCGGPFPCCGGRIPALLLSQHQMGLSSIVGERRPPLVRERCPAAPPFGSNICRSRIPTAAKAKLAKDLGRLGESSSVKGFQFSAWSFAISPHCVARIRRRGGAEPMGSVQLGRPLPHAHSNSTRLCRRQAVMRCPP